MGDDSNPPGSRWVDRQASIIQAVSALGTMGAFIAAAAAFWWSLHVDQRSDIRTAKETNEEYVRHVSLQEAPQYACALQRECLAADSLQWVVINANPVQLREVWISDAQDRRIRVGNVPGCTMYAVPASFRPVAAHFEDPHAQWAVFAEEPYDEATSQYPESDDADSSWNEDVQNCP